MDLIAELERELSIITPEQCPALLGELERLKALAWVQLNTQDRRGAAGSSEASNDLLTIPEVSERLALPLSRVYELARQGKFPVVKVGKYVRVEAAQIARWIEDHRDMAFDTKVSFKDTARHANARLSAKTLSSENDLPSISWTPG